MKITRQAYDDILSQARRELPNEACGYLFGHGDTAEVSHPMTNADHSPEHFSFIPQEQFTAVRRARREGWQVVGNWHSHPASPSRPSQEDIRLAYDPGIVYFILSLADPEPVLNAFSIRGGQVEKLPLELTE